MENYLYENLFMWPSQEFKVEASSVPYSYIVYESRAALHYKLSSYRRVRLSFPVLEYSCSRRVSMAVLFF